MDTTTTGGLVDLLLDLERAGVQELVAEGDRLRYRPRCAMTPALAERLRTRKAGLLIALRSAVFSGNKGEESIEWDDCVDPPDPCPICEGLQFWWNLHGQPRCLRCNPPTLAIRLMKRAASIRRRQGIPNPPELAERLAKLKRLMQATGRSTTKATGS